MDSSNDRKNRQDYERQNGRSPKSPAVELHDSQLRQQWIDAWTDGLLSGAQQRQLLAYYDAHPEMWRELALGFVSASVWSEALGGGAAGADRRSTAARLPSMAALAPAPARLLPDRESESLSRGRRNRMSRSLAWLVAAAMLPVGWWTGRQWSAHEWERMGQEVATHVTHPSESDGRVARSQSDEGFPSDRTPLTWIDGQVWRARSAEDLSAAAESALPPDEWLRWAQQSGYDVEVQSRLVPARDQLGRSYWVPVSQTQLQEPRIWNN
jgi:hypothetical protein